MHFLGFTPVYISSPEQRSDYIVLATLPMPMIFVEHTNLLQDKCVSI